MLNRLEISNYALIENVNLKLGNGFTVITGETGAGKSILLKALNLLLGERADTSVLNQSEKKCFLEAEFAIENLKLQAYFEENELDYSDNCILRREFTTSGKSRTFINDTPVQLNQIKELGQQLISIHTQHETLAIFNADFQRDTLDYYAGIDKDVARYKTKYSKYRSQVNELMVCKVKDQENRKEKDYIEFLLAELEEANLPGLDIEELRVQHAKIEHAEKIKNGIDFALSIFENDKIGPLVGVKTLLETFDDLKKYSPNFADTAARLLSVKIELDDLESEIARHGNEDYYSDEETAIIQDKLDKFNALSFKHNLREVEQLIELQRSLSDQLLDISNMEDQIKGLEKSIAELEKELLTTADEISEKRNRQKEALEKATNAILKKLAMPDAELQIEIARKDKISASGIDAVNYLFKTNLGGTFAPIKKVASGGELSRLMLALMSILSKSKDLPTLIFDEIDTGVSGEVAAKIATEFEEMGKKIQVIAITHLAQVAGRGAEHLHVSKYKSAHKTNTTVQLLNKEERINVLAQMISGEKITDIARENAIQLLKTS